MKTNLDQEIGISFEKSKVTKLESFQELAEFSKSITKTKIMTGNEYRYFPDDESGAICVGNEELSIKTSKDAKSLIVTNKYFPIP